MLHTSESPVSHGCLTKTSREAADVVSAPPHWQVWCGHPVALGTLCSKGIRHHMVEERADSCSCSLTSVYVKGRMESPSFFFKRCSHSRNLALLLSIQQRNQTHTLESYSCHSVTGFTPFPKETSFLLSCTERSAVMRLYSLWELPVLPSSFFWAHTLSSSFQQELYFSPSPQVLHVRW